MSKAEERVIRDTRSVLDYDTEDELRKALMSCDLNEHQSRSTMEDPDLTGGFQDTTLDWVLPTYDPATTEAQSMKEEIRRLQVLKSYEVLESEREHSFDRITDMAARIFNVPVALISLIDLGRQWFLSNRGLEGATETRRKIAFCAHAILTKNNILLVLDATKDFRFQNNPAVVGEPHVRFYAGAPLIAPEGYKLGTLCLVDFKPRLPTEFTDENQATLMDMAQIVVETMVHRKRARLREENPARVIAYTAHDLMTPLSGVQLSLSLLTEDREMQEKLSFQQAELLTTALSCSELMIKICKSAAEVLEDDECGDVGLDTDLLDGKGSNNMPVTRIDQLLKSLRMMTESIPKEVPVVIRISPNVPPLILCDDLKLFRAALSLLSSAIYRTRQGGIQLRIYQSENKLNLVFEVEDTADDIPVEDYPHLFKPCKRDDGSLRLCLASVASLVNSIDGDCGFRPRNDNSIETCNSTLRYLSGSYFWFSVPLFSPDRLGASGLHLHRKTNGSSDFGPHTPFSTSWSRNAGFATTKTSLDSTQSKRNDDSRTLDGLYVSELVNTELGAVQSNPNGVLKSPSADASIDASKPADSNTAGIQSVPRSPEQRPRKVLVVDDSIVIRKSLSIALSKAGFSVVHAVNGWEGLSQLKETLFDIVFCDILMPTMDGLDCVKQYREWERAYRPAWKQFIVGISSHAHPEAISQSLKAGMDDFRAKPITARTLTEIYNSSIALAHARTLDCAFELEHHIRESMDPAGEEAVVDSNEEMVARERENDEDLLMISNDECQEYGKKRQRTEVMAQNRISVGQLVCLMVTDRPSAIANEAFNMLEKDGWKIVVVHDESDTSRVLKMRNWDLVLIDEVLQNPAKRDWIAKYRLWEHEHRISRQRNVVLLSDYDVPSPSDQYAFVHAPDGFNYAIRKPVSWGDLSHILKACQSGESIH